MLATDWSRYGEVPADLVRAACGISGVYDLAPLVRTSINEALGLDLPAARAASPLLWPAPAGDRTFLAAVGGEESGEFVRQSRKIARVWSAAGVRAECMVVPGADHFTVIDELARTPGALFRQVLQLASP
jgi:arylformamidase